MKQYTFIVVGCVVAVEWETDYLSAMICAAFSGFLPCESTHSTHLAYRIVSEFNRERFRVTRNGMTLAQGLDSSMLLFAVQQDIVVSTQVLRPDLFFIHAAVIERDGFAFVLAAPSGSGKSTLCWAMLHQGFRLMSDELGPVNPNSLMVEPFLLAVTLKSRPPACCPLPAQAFTTRRAIYIPVDALPTMPARESALIRAILFVSYAPTNLTPAFRKLSAAEATSRLYPNVLNGLAHDSMGVDNAIRLTRAVKSYCLASADLAETARDLAAYTELI